MSVRRVSSYSQVQAIVRARYSGLLQQDTWAALVECRDSSALLSLLSKTAYGPYLDIAPDLLTARRTVYQVRWRLAYDYERLIDVTPQPGHQLLVALWRSYEVDNLKAALRGVETGASWDQVRHLLSPMVEYITLTTADIEAIVHSGGITQAIECVRHTPYYETLIHALERYQAEENLFPLEVALDLDYRRGLWRSIQMLGGRDHDEALRLVGTGLDTDNLLWALRYRVYHALSEEEIINYTLPFGYMVHDEDIRAIAAGADVSPIIRRLYSGFQEPDQVADRESGGLRRLEHYLQERLNGMCRATFRSDPFHIGLPIAYLILCESEIRNLTTIIEAKASQLAPAVFEPILAG